MNLNFEIMISQKDGLFVAQSANFPECKGYGQSEEEALHDLADSISLQLSDSIKQVLNDFLESGLLESALKDIDQKKDQFSIQKQKTSMGTQTHKILVSGKWPSIPLAKLKKVNPEDASRKNNQRPGIFAKYIPSQMGLGSQYGLGLGNNSSSAPLDDMSLLGDLIDPMGFMISLN